jgi:hypothetical protein
MPIRTNRGRAAVYRRLWGWPLRSPRHLVGAIVGLIVLAIVIAVVVPRIRPAANHHSTPPPSSVTSGNYFSGGTAGTSSTTPTTTPETRLTTVPERPTSAPPAPNALAVAQSWAAAWVHHPVGMTAAQWLDQLRPYTEPEFLAASMSTIDPRNIQATTVTGPPQAMASYTSSVVVRLPTNSGPLDITVVNTPTGWLVSTYTGGP